MPLGELMSKRLRNWCFTINNYSEEDVDSVRMFGLSDACRFLVVGKECGVGGTKHLQGYMELRRSTRLNGIKKLGGFERAHLEERRGTPAEAAAYCRKDGDWWSTNEDGVPECSQGQRSDLQSVCEAIGAGASIAQVAVDYPAVFVRYHRGIERLRDVVRGRRQRAGEPHVIWITGSSGVGKTRLAHELEPDAYLKNGTKWWDGYEGQEAVIMDDWRPDSMQFEELLRVLDRYPHQVEVKGGTRWLEANRFILTSIKSPLEMYKVCGEDIEQLQRRITEIKTL